MANKAKQSFEKSLKDLEKIVTALESGDLPLEKALDKFETGMQLSRICSKTLDDAEQRVSVLMANDSGMMDENPFDPNAK